MNESTTHLDFQSWLESRRWTRAEDRPFSIAIECEQRPICDEIGLNVARYLSEVHSGAPNGWLYFSAELVSSVTDNADASDLSQAFPELAAGGHRSCDEARCAFLSSIARTGGAVFYLPDTCGSLRGHSDLFVVGLRNSDDEDRPASRADLTLALNRIDPRTAVRVAADSALEWAAARVPTAT